MLDAPPPKGYKDYNEWLVKAKTVKCSLDDSKKIKVQ